MLARRVSTRAPAGLAAGSSVRSAMGSRGRGRRGAGMTDAGMSLGGALAWAGAAPTAQPCWCVSVRSVSAAKSPMPARGRRGRRERCWTRRDNTGMNEAPTL